jgi:hypothetical protein
MMIFALVTLVTLLLALQTPYFRRRHPRPPRDIHAGSVSDAHLARLTADDARLRHRLLLPIVLLSALAIATPSCVHTPPTTTPAPIGTPAAAHLAQVQRVLDATRKVGLVAEQVQAAEIALYRGGSVPALTAAVHATIQTAFQKTAASVIAATGALVHAVETTDPATVVRALRDGVTDLAKALQLYSASLAGWLGTADALLELALA